MAARHHLPHVGDELAHARHVVGEDEALEHDPHGDDPHYVAKGHRLAGVIALYHAADREARVLASVGESGVEVVAADVVEINVDALGGGFGQALHQRTGLIVDHRVGTERLHELALVRAAGGADHGHALGLGDLYDGRAHGAGRRGHEHDVARLRLRRIEQPPIGCAPRQAEVAEKRLRADTGDARKLVEAGCGNHGFLPPARHVHDEVAGGKAVRAALDHFSDGSALKRLADLKRGNIALHVVHPSAHVRVDRQPAVTHPDLPVGKLR